MKHFIAGFLLMALPSFGQVAMMALDDIPGTKEVCVTNWGPFIVTGLSDKATTQFVNQAVAPLSARLDAVDTSLDDGTNNWNTAYSWGDHAGLYRVIGWVPSWTDVTDKPAAFPPEAHQHDYTAITNPPWLTEYTESDPIALAALAAHSAYWPPNATASSWFNFVTNSGAITITGYNIDGGTDVRIPSYINGWPVKVIGDGVFRESDIESVHGDVVTIGTGAFHFCTSLTTAPFPQATTIGDEAFSYCTRLTTASFPQATTIGTAAFYSCDTLTTAYFPQATTIGNSAFSYCTRLTTAYFPQATTIGADVFHSCTSLVDITLGTDAANFNVSAFNNINANPTITISNPHAKGWGETFAGLAVVRPDLHGDKIYQAGLPVATEAHVAQEIAAIPEPDLSSRVAVSGGTATNLTTRGWFALPQSVAGTNLTYRLVVSNDVILAIGVWQ